MQKIIILPFLVILVVLMGCVAEEKDITNFTESTEIVCDNPYMRFGNGCCLDQNENNICDNDESSQEDEKEIIEEPKEVEEDIGEQCSSSANIDFLGLGILYNTGLEGYELPELNIQIENTGTCLIKNPEINVKSIQIESEVNHLKQLNLEIEPGDTILFAVDLKGYYFARTKDFSKRFKPFKLITELIVEDEKLSEDEYYLQYDKQYEFVRRYPSKSKKLNSKTTSKGGYSIEIDKQMSDEDTLYVRVSNENEYLDLVDAQVDLECYYGEELINYRVKELNFTVGKGYRMSNWIWKPSYCSKVKLILREGEHQDMLAQTTSQNLLVDIEYPNEFYEGSTSEREYYFPPEYFN